MLREWKSHPKTGRAKMAWEWFDKRYKSRGGCARLTYTGHYWTGYSCAWPNDDSMEIHTSRLDKDPEDG